MSMNDILTLIRCCEKIDTIVCLSTIHYFPVNEIQQLLWLFGILANELIIEFPSPKEQDVAEKLTVESLANPKHLLEKAFDYVSEIGEASSPKESSVLRKI